MRTDRLTKLADLLDGLPSDHFNMEYWGRGETTASDTLDMNACGTVACAFGWACSIPEFKEAGLSLEIYSKGFRLNSYLPTFVTQSMSVPMGKVTYQGYTAAEKFFEISPDETAWLFAPDRYCPEDEDEAEWDAAAVKPAEVADRIRALLRGEGPDPETL